MSNVVQLSLPRPGEVVDFMAFWSLWLGMRRGICKKDAERAFYKALRRASFETILAGAERYAKAMAGEDPKHIAHASTWLNGDRWEDQADDTAERKAQSQSDFDQWCIDWVNKGRNLALRRHDADRFVRSQVQAGKIDESQARKAGYL